MKIGILITHPTQFDVPIFKLGSDTMEVIYTNEDLINNMFDPEIGKTLTWGNNNMDGYSYEIVPKKGGLVWLFKKLRKSKYDLLIINGYYNKYFILAILFGKMLTSKTALRLDTVQFNNEGKVKTLYKKILYSIFKRLIDVFFVVGSLSRNFLLKQGISQNSISYYGYISDNDFFSKASHLSKEEKLNVKMGLGIPEYKKIVLCVSKHSQREAPFDTLEAFKKLNDDNLHLLLIGDGPLHEEVKRRAYELDIKNITFAGYINFTKLPLYYSISDLFVHDSHNEPWGVSVQEAIACGVTVIASDKVGAAYDLIVNGKNGYMFEAGNLIDLADKVKLSLALDREIKQETNLSLLNEWNYAKTLQNIIARA